MKGRKRSLCNPRSYRLSGARFEVTTRIYTCVHHAQKYKFFVNFQLKP